MLYLQSLTGFRIRQSLNKYSLTSRATLLSVLYEMFISVIVNLDIFRHIHVLFRHIQQWIFQTFDNSDIWIIQTNEYGYSDKFRHMDIQTNG